MEKSICPACGSAAQLQDLLVAEYSRGYKAGYDSAKKENQRLQSIIANQTTRQYLEHYQTKDNTSFTPEEVGFLEEGLQSEAEENQRLQAIIEKQRDAIAETLDWRQLYSSASHGLIVRLQEALALTQQPSSEAV